MKGGKWRQERPRTSQNGDHEGRQMKGDKWRQEQPRADHNGDHEGRQMKGGKWRQEQPRAGQNGDHEGRQMKAGAAKSRPEWRSCRGTNEGRQMKAGAAKSRPEWRSQSETNQGRLGGSGRDFGDQQPYLWEVRTPIASSYLGKKPGEEGKPKKKRIETFSWRGVWGRAQRLPPMAFEAGTEQKRKATEFCKDVSDEWHIGRCKAGEGGSTKTKV